MAQNYRVSLTHIRVYVCMNMALRLVVIAARYCMYPVCVCLCMYVRKRFFLAVMQWMYVHTCFCVCSWTRRTLTVIAAKAFVCAFCMHVCMNSLPCMQGNHYMHKHVCMSSQSLLWGYAAIHVCANVRTYEWGAHVVRLIMYAHLCVIMNKAYTLSLLLGVACVCVWMRCVLTVICVERRKCTCRLG